MSLDDKRGRLSRLAPRILLKSVGAAPLSVQILWNELLLLPSALLVAFFAPLLWFGKGDKCVRRWMGGRDEAFSSYAVHSPKQRFIIERHSPQPSLFCACFDVYVSTPYYTDDRNDGIPKRRLPAF